MSRTPPAPRVLRVPALSPELAQPLDAAWWPRERLAEGLEALARHSGLMRQAASDGAPVLPALLDEPALDGWVGWAAERLGIEAEPIDATVPEMGDLLRRAAPAILPWDGLRGEGFLLLHRVRGATARLVGPDLALQGCKVADLRTALCWAHEAPLMPEIDRLLKTARVPAARRPRVRDAMLRERLSGVRAPACWMLRQPASAPFGRQLLQARAPQLVGAMLMSFALLYGFELLGWKLIGQGVLDGRVDSGWLLAWLLLMLTMLPLQIAGSGLHAAFALRVSRLLKSRLLAGALRMNLDVMRSQGVGRLLGRVIESQALESLVVNGGLSVGVALLELVFAAGVLAFGAAGPWHLALLAGWVLLTVGLAAFYVQRQKRWTLMRLELTHDLVEQMVGHRTRLAQEQAARRDARDDGALQAYLHTSAAMDRASVPVLAGLPSGWLLVGMAALAPVFVAGGASPGALAVSVGGLLLAQRALGSLVGGLTGLARAAIAWREVAPLFHAGAQAGVAPPPAFAAPATRPPAAPGAPLIEAHGLGFAHPGGAPVLQAVDLRIAHGDRLLLEGPSGGGKSTLAALLTGLRQPGSGLLLLHGLDRPTWGDAWSSQATAAPQFHENHVLSGTLAFNLLLGRAWPASAADLRDAETLCHELGLGPLLQRMPGGLNQRIGETGWQLSHGERSRLFLARALLQRAPLTVMDESFAALDPQTLARCLAVAMRRADALMVIAHP